MVERPIRGRDEATRLAEAILEFRRARAAELPSELFSKTGWEYLLELFVADAGSGVFRRVGFRLPADDEADRPSKEVSPGLVLSRVASAPPPFERLGS